MRSAVRVLIVVLCIFAWPLAGVSGVSDEGGLEIVTLVSSEPVVIAPGETVEVMVRFTIKEGYHLQANPAANVFFFPTILKIDGVENIVPGRPIYPPSQPLILAGSSDTLLTYEGDLRIMVPVAVDAGAVEGEYFLKGQLAFQPCDSRKCLFPRKIPVSIPLSIVAPNR